MTTSCKLTSGESRPPGISGSFPYGFKGGRFSPQDLLYHATRVIQMLFSLSSCNRYYYLFAFCVRKEPLSVSLQQTATTKLLGLKKKCFESSEVNKFLCLSNNSLPISRMMVVQAEVLCKRLKQQLLHNIKLQQHSGPRATKAHCTVWFLPEGNLNGPDDDEHSAP